MIGLLLLFGSDFFFSGFENTCLVYFVCFLCPLTGQGDGNVIHVTTETTTAVAKREHPSPTVRKPYFIACIMVVCLPDLTSSVCLLIKGDRNCCII